MKNSLLIFGVLLLVLLLPISAVNLNSKSEFDKGETFIANVTGNFYTPFSESDVYFYKGPTRIAMDTSVKKIGDYYYIYAQLKGKSAGNYSVEIKNAQLVYDGQVIEQDISGNFSISDDEADFYVEPAVFSGENNFSLILTNLKSSEIEVNVDKQNSDSGGSFFDIFFGSSSSGEPISIGPEKSKEVFIYFDNLTESSSHYVKLTSDNTEYVLPAYITISEEEDVEEEESKEIEFRPKEITLTAPTNSETQRIVYLYNRGNVDLENITISVQEKLKDYVTLSDYNLSINDNRTKEITLTFFSDKEANFSGQLTAQADGEDIYAYLVLNVSFIPDYVPSDNETGETISSIFRCDELGGQICNSTQVCRGESEEALDGKCCLEPCEDKSESTNTKLIGWIIIIILVGLVVWFFIKKYKGVGKRGINLLDIARRKKN